MRKILRTEVEHLHVIKYASITKKNILLQSVKCKKKNKRMIIRKLDAVKIYTNISFDKLYIVIVCQYNH